MPFLGSRKNISPKELSEYLFIDRSNLSKLIKSLEDKKIITFTTSETDSRCKLINLTASGRKIFEKALSLNQEIAEQGLLPLTKTERTQVGKLYASISSGFGAPEFSLGANIEYFLPQQYRLGQITGMIGTNYMGTGMDVRQYQIFFQLYNFNHPVKFNELSSRVPLDASSVSRTVDRFVAQGLIAKKNSEKDGRQVYVSLTKKGLEFFEKHQNKIAEKFQGALSKYKERDLKSYLKPLIKSNEHELKVKKNEQLKINKVNTQEEIYRARAFFVESLVRRKAHLKLDSEILPNKSHSFYLEKNKKIVALAVLDSAGEILNLEFAPNFKDENKKTAFTKASVSELLAK